MADRKRFYAAALMVTLLSGCVGHGGFVPSPSGQFAQPNLATSVGSTPSRAGSGFAEFSISIPKPKSAADYVSINTRSVVIEMTSPKKSVVAVVNLEPKTKGCEVKSRGLVCTLREAVPAARDRFLIRTFDGKKGHGKALSVAKAVAKVFSAKTTPVRMVLEGIVASISVELQDPSLPIGKTSTTGVDVLAKDASGALIVGGSDYDHQITLTDGDGSGATTLSQTRVVSPTTKIEFTYYGSASLQRATISARASGVPATSVSAGSMVPIPVNATETISEQVDANVGATLTLEKEGSSVNIPAGALAQSSVVQVALVSAPQVGATAGPLQPISSTVRVTLGIPQQVSSSGESRRKAAASMPQITMTLSPTLSQSELRYRAAHRAHYYGYDSPFALAILQVCDTTGCYPTVGNPAQSSTSLSLQIFQGIFAALHPIIAFELFLATSPVTQSIVSPGLRYWDPNATPSAGGTHWTSDPPPYSASHPVLLLHGIFSSVEASFGDNMVKQLRANGGYDVVIGYDYDWMDTADNEATNVAEGVSTLGYANLDIVSHSMGTLVAMGTAAKLRGLPNSLPYSYQSYPTLVQNCILIEGPLNGALSVNPESLMTDAVLVSSLYGPPAVGGSEMVGALGVLLLWSPWAQQFQPNSAVQQTVENAFRASPPPRVSEIAGNQPLNDWEPIVYQMINHEPMPTPNDGVMPTASEIYPVLPQPNAGAQQNGVPESIYTATDNATHAGTNDITNNLLYEQFIDQQIAFSVDNANPATDIYDDGTTPSVFMKGISTQTALCVFDDSTVKFSPEATSLNRTLFDTQPAPPPLAPWQTEAEDPSTCSASTTYSFTLIGDGTVALTPTTLPSQATVFDTMDSDMNVTPDAIDLDIWALPSCTVGPTTGPGGCLFQPTVVSEARSLKILDAYKHAPHRTRKGHFSVRPFFGHRR